jgi:phosphate-selective porin OprO/OprP
MTKLVRIGVVIAILSRIGSSGIALGQVPVSEAYQVVPLPTPPGVLTAWSPVESKVAQNSSDSGAPLPCPSETNEDSLQKLQQRIEALEKALSEKSDSKASDPQKGATDKSKPEKQESEKDATKKKEADSKQPEWVDMSNDKWNVKLGGHIQMDYINWANADPAIANAENYFSYRRLRLVADGTGYGVFDFRLQMTLEPGQGSHENQFASPDVKDAYVTMNEIPLLGRMRVGNFFVPFSLEQVTNDTMNIFNERSIPTQGVFAADREVGLAFYNCTPDQNISWASGVFFDDINDTIKTRFGDRQGSRVSGRLVWLPFYDEPSNGRYLIHTGLAVLHTDTYNDLVRFRARPQIQRGPILIDSGNVAANSYTTGGLELAVVWGAITVQNEAFVAKVNRLGSDSATVGGAYTHVSYFLTGENRVYERFGQHGAQFGRNKPFTNFFATRGGCGWGAWEAKARWSHLNLTDIDRGQYNDLTVGFNWYWSDRTRIMFDWIHPITSRDTVFGETSSDLLAMRFDVNW